MLDQTYWNEGEPDTLRGNYIAVMHALHESVNSPNYCALHVKLLARHLNRSLRPKASRSFFNSKQFTLDGIGTNFKPLDSRLTSSGDRLASERLTTVRGRGWGSSMQVGLGSFGSSWTSVHFSGFVADQSCPHVEPLPRTSRSIFFLWKFMYKCKGHTNSRVLIQMCTQSNTSTLRNKW